MQLLNIDFVATDNALSGELCRVGYGEEVCLRTVAARHFRISFYNPEGPKRIFISRKESRRLVNEKEIRAYVESLDFTRCILKT